MCSSRTSQFPASVQRNFERCSKTCSVAARSREKTAGSSFSSRHERRAKHASKRRTGPIHRSSCAWPPRSHSHLLRCAWCSLARAVWRSWRNEAWPIPRWRPFRLSFTAFRSPWRSAWTRCPTRVCSAAFAECGRPGDEMEGQDGAPKAATTVRSSASAGPVSYGQLTLSAA